MDEQVFQLLRTLPPLVACIAWDVVNDNITTKTIELADSATDDEWRQYEVVRCVAAGNPDYPPVEEAQLLVKMMVEELAVRVG